MARSLLAALLVLAASACSIPRASIRLGTGEPVYGIDLASPGPVSAEALAEAGLEEITEADGRLSGRRALSEYSVENLIVWLEPDGSRRPAALLLEPRDDSTFAARCTGELLGHLEGIGAVTRMQGSTELYCVDTVREDEQRRMGFLGAVLWTRQFEAVAPRLGAFVPLVQLGKRWKEAFARRDFATLAADRLLWLRADRTALPEIAAYDPALQAAEAEAKEKADSARREEEARDAAVLARLDPELVAEGEHCPSGFEGKVGEVPTWVDGPRTWRSALARGELFRLRPCLDARLQGVNGDGQWSYSQTLLLEKFRSYLEAARLSAISRGKRVTAARLALLMNEFGPETKPGDPRVGTSAARAEERAFFAGLALELLPLRIESDGPLPSPWSDFRWIGLWVSRSAERPAAKGAATLSHGAVIEAARSAVTKKGRYSEEYWVNVEVGGTASEAPTAAGPAPGSARSEQLLSRLDELDAAIAIQRERARTGAGDRAASAGVANPGYDPTSPRSEPFSSIQGGGLSGSAAWRIQDAEAELRKLEAEKAAIEGELTRGGAPRAAPTPRRTERELRTRVVERELPTWDVTVVDTLVLVLPDGTRHEARCELKESIADWGELKTAADAKGAARKLIESSCTNQLRPVWAALARALHARAEAVAALETDRCEALMLRDEFAEDSSSRGWYSLICIEP